MSTSKDIWEVDNAWVNYINLVSIPTELLGYHPDDFNQNPDYAPYHMKMKSMGQQQYKIFVEIDRRPGNNWNKETKKLLDNIQLSPDPQVANRLTANKKTKLHEVIGYNFGDWAYVTLRVDWAEKQDGNQRPYNEYTSTLTWEKEQPTAVVPIETSYKWRD